MKSVIRRGACAAVLLLLALVAGRCVSEREASAATAEPHQGLLYGRVTTEEGDIIEGRLRFGGEEEALWGNHFNGYVKENPWAAYAPRERLSGKDLSFTVFGFEIAVGRSELGRPFLARFGDIARIDARGRDLRVTLKSGTVAHLDRYAADDFADGVRVWDGSGGSRDLNESEVRSIEFLSTPHSGDGPRPLHGTVRTRGGDFTGFIQWDREAAVGPDWLHGRSDDGEVSLRFDALRSIARRSGHGALLTLADGREIALSETRQDRRGNRGMYVDDPRFGRVLVSWEAFERVDFTPGGSGPAYDDFRPGRPLRGTVMTHDGRRLSGRLVFDLDESETTATLDAPSQGVDYTIPFALIASVHPLPADGADGVRVMLQGGEELRLERAGDLGEGNGGMLVFTGGQEGAEYLRWGEIERIDFVAPAE